VQELSGGCPYTLEPDEVVALGAAVQAGILAGLERDACCWTSSRCRGHRDHGRGDGQADHAQHAHPLPGHRAVQHVRGRADQRKINACQGERELARDCRSLGEFELRGLPPMPAGIPKILVTFLIDENGILNVSAIEERSRKEASIQIVPKYGLTSDEVRSVWSWSLTPTPAKT